MALNMLRESKSIALPDFCNMINLFLCSISNGYITWVNNGKKAWTIKTAGEPMIPPKFSKRTITELRVNSFGTQRRNSDRTATNI
jgi:hypothetical protein